MRSERSGIGSGWTACRLVVVGGGMAAHRLIERLVASGASQHLEITVLSEELHAPYDRVQLGTVLEGAAAESLALRDPDWYAACGIELRLKQRVLEIDRAARTVRTDSGALVDYDELVLATGGTPLRPPVPGFDREGVVTYRTLEDVERIVRHARAPTRIVVAGGGLLGLEAGRALQRRGCRVEIVEMAPRLLPRQLDAVGARVLEAKVRELGLGLRIQTRIVAIHEAPAGLAVELDTGDHLAADLVIVAAGIRPQDALARAAGLECHPAGGIVVDDALVTSDPSIHAIGECVRHRDVLHGFVAPCHAMAEVLAARITGESRTFTGSVPSARLKIEEIDVVAIGDSLEDGLGISGLEWSTPDAYRRLVVRDGRLVGAMAVGGSPELARIQESIARGAMIRVSQRRRFLRTGRLHRHGGAKPVAQWPDAAVLCTCTGVTCGALRAARVGGARSGMALSEATSAGTVCGTCVPLLEELAGERETARRSGVGRGLGIAAAVALALLGLVAWIGPIPMSTSVAAGPSLDVLWRDGFWKQVSGFGLVGLTALGLLFSLRKRWSRFDFGSYGGWRLAHSAIGVTTVIGLALHTGFHMGAHLNFLLMVSFLGVVVTGSLAAAVTSLERRLPTSQAVAVRRSWTALHVFVFWPLPVFTAFHVLAVYFY